MVIRNNIRALFFFSLLTFFVCGTFARAATLQIVPSTSTYAVGDTVRLRVAVSSDTQAINGASVNVSFPSDMLTLTSVSKTGSIMTLWAQEPTYSNSAGTASWEAVALNGFNGKDGTLATLVFKAKKAGKATVAINTSTVLANNGEGTNVLTSKQGGTVTITTAPARVDQPIVPGDDAPVQVADTITIEEIKKLDAKSPKARFRVTTLVPQFPQVYDVQIDDLPLITWTDDGTNIFETPVLARGTHLIKFKTITASGTTLSAFADFVTDNLNTPIITDYPVNVFAGEFVVLKGIADPNTTIVFTTTRQPSRFPLLSRLTGVTGDTTPRETTVTTNDKGEFNYISPDRVEAGTYSIYARARSEGGLESMPTVPVRVAAHADIFSRLTLWLTNTLSLIVPLLALLFVFFFIIIYTLAKYKRFKRKVAADLISSESDVRKRFQAIDSDLEEYAKLLIKTHTSQRLTDDERQSLVRIKQDISSTERSISGDIKRTQDRLL